MLNWKKKEEKESCVLTRDFTLACTIVLLKIKGVSCWSSKCYGSLVLDLVRDGTCLLVGGVDRTASSAGRRRRPGSSKGGHDDVYVDPPAMRSHAGDDKNVGN